MINTVESRWGPCTYFLKDQYVGRSVHNYGEYGPDETEMILGLASGVCLDIGANIGCISMALEANGFPVIAYEPQPAVYDLLRKNVKGTVINSAVGSSVGFALMPKVQYSEKCNVGGLGIGTKSMYGFYEVPVTTIDSDLYKARIGFIKLDVEGHELEALRGAENTIRSHRPVMYIEDDRPEKSKKLREFITFLGYSITEHKPELYRENNFFGLKKNIWDRRFASHNLICTPC